jgi:hypothetical protein
MESSHMTFLDLELCTFFSHLSRSINPLSLAYCDLLRLTSALQSILFPLTTLFAVISPPSFSTERAAAE